MHLIKKYVLTIIVALIGLALMLPLFAQDNQDNEQKAMEVEKIVTQYQAKVDELDGCLRNNEVYNYTASKWRAGMLAKAAKHMSSHEATTIINADTLNSCSSTCKIAVIKLEECGPDFPKKAEESAAIDGCTLCCTKLMGEEACSIPL